jgi:lipopolysaccharide assembly outer membrane protein LptD (OstA)
LQANKHPLVFLWLLLFGTVSILAQEDKIEPLPIAAIKDTITAPLFPQPVARDTVKTDSTAIDSLDGKQPLLAAKIKYKAKDYVKLSQKEQKIYLYNEAEIYYQDTELKAGIIIMDYIKNEVYAGRIRDSLGNYTQHPYFKQGDNVVIPDSIRFNFDTEKALIWNSRSEQLAGLGQLGCVFMKVYE